MQVKCKFCHRARQELRTQCAAPLCSICEALCGDGAPPMVKEIETLLKSEGRPLDESVDKSKSEKIALESQVKLTCFEESEKT